MRPENGMRNRGSLSGELCNPEVTSRKGALPKVHFIDRFPTPVLNHPFQEEPTQVHWKSMMNCPKSDFKNKNTV
jgi:hypothetical protein